MPSAYQNQAVQYRIEVIQILLIRHPAHSDPPYSCIGKYQRGNARRRAVCELLLGKEGFPSGADEMRLVPQLSGQLSHPF